MVDQVAALQARGLPACYLGSAQGNVQVKEDAWAGRFMYVYMTPELAVHSTDRLLALHAAQAREATPAGERGDAATPIPPPRQSTLYPQAPSLPTARRRA
jgi:hypothetical protein